MSDYNNLRDDVLHLQHLSFIECVYNSGFSKQDSRQKKTVHCDADGSFPFQEREYGKK